MIYSFNHPLFYSVYLLSWCLCPLVYKKYNILYNIVKSFLCYLFWSKSVDFDLRSWSGGFAWQGIKRGVISTQSLNQANYIYYQNVMSYLAVFQVWGSTNNKPVVILLNIIKKLCYLYIYIPGLIARNDWYCAIGQPYPVPLARGGLKNNYRQVRSPRGP